MSVVRSPVARVVVFDGLVVALAGLVVVFGTRQAAPWTGGTRALDLWAYALMAAAVVALAGRRVWPLATLVVTIALSVVYGRFTLKGLKTAAFNTMTTSSMVLFLAVASNVFGAIFARLGSASLITNALAKLPVPPFVTLLLVMGLIFLLGWPFEWPAIIFVFLPIFYPVVEALKYDMIWFGALVAVNLQTAYLSPPVAMSAYYLKQVVPQWSLGTIYRGMADFMVIQVIALILVMLFPEIALWFPRWLFDQP